MPDCAGWGLESAGSKVHFVPFGDECSSSVGYWTSTVLTRPFLRALVVSLLH